MNAALRDLRFLIVEDMGPVREALKSYLLAIGAVVIDQAVSYHDAVRRIRAFMPDFVICDYVLGNGRTGQQLLDEMRREDLPESVAWIMVTAERGYQQVMAAAECAPDDYILKPYTPDVLDVRIQRVLARKNFFRGFYKARAAGKCDEALGVLAGLESQQPLAGRFRFDILRYRASVLLQAGRCVEAAGQYEAIVAVHPFPWALLGKAQALFEQRKFDLAREAAQTAIDASPQFFVAHDLLAQILVAEGSTVEAQRVLVRAAHATPRNAHRKRGLAQVAAINGDHALAGRALREAMEQDVVGGTSLDDRLQVVRLALRSGDRALAEREFAEIPVGDVMAAGMAIRISFQCLKSCLDAEHGSLSLKRVRDAALKQDWPMSTVLDVVEAALTQDDLMLADAVTMRALQGDSARPLFRAIHELYQGHGMPERFIRARESAARAVVQRRQADAAGVVGE